jgi:hypothetical protein
MPRKPAATADPAAEGTPPTEGADQTAPAPTITLADLPPDVRAALLAEAAAEKQAVAQAAVQSAEDAGAARNAAIAALMDDRDHLRNCPGGRVEAYQARKPARPADAIPARNVTVIRCIECGGSLVLEQEYAVTNAAIDQAAAEIASKTTAR